MELTQLSGKRYGHRLLSTAPYQLPSAISASTRDDASIPEDDTSTNALLPAHASEASQSTRTSRRSSSTRYYTSHIADDGQASDLPHPPSTTAFSSAQEDGTCGSVPPNVNDDPTCSTTHDTHCTPFWLGKTTLLALVALFVSLMTPLVVVWYVSKSQNGFRPVLSQNHDAWTYGPTAVLVIVLSFWRQVDYCCKIVQPWQELRNGPVNAKRSMLLDYLSPPQISSFVQAIRNRHTAVAASIAGFAVLKAVIVLSTGLLTLVPVSVTAKNPVTITTAFDSARIWNTIPADDAAGAYWIRTGGILGTYSLALDAPIYPNLSS